MRSANLPKTLAIALSLGLSAATAGAATLYDEGAQGDLDFSSPTTLTLSEGGNSIVGASFLYGSDSGFGDDFDNDPFAFIVPAGLQVRATTIAFTTTSLGGIPLTNVAYRLSDANHVPILVADPVNLFGASPVTLFTALPGPIPDGLYRWDEASWGAHISTATQWQYEITFDVVAVPEPSTFALALAGLVGTGLFARRRRIR